MVSFVKCRRIASIISDIQMYQNESYALEVEPSIRVSDLREFINLIMNFISWIKFFWRQIHMFTFSLFCHPSKILFISLLYLFLFVNSTNFCFIDCYVLLYVKSCINTIVKNYIEILEIGMFGFLAPFFFLFEYLFICNDSFIIPVIFFCRKILFHILYSKNF